MSELDKKDRFATEDVVASTADRVRANRMDQRLATARAKRQESLKTRGSVAGSGMTVEARSSDDDPEGAGPSIADIMGRASKASATDDASRAPVSFLHVPPSSLERSETDAADPPETDMNSALKRPVEGLGRGPMIQPEPPIPEPIAGAAASLGLTEIEDKKRPGAMVLILGFVLGALLALGVYLALVFEGSFALSQAMHSDSSGVRSPVVAENRDVALTDTTKPLAPTGSVFLKPPQMRDAAVASQ